MAKTLKQKAIPLPSDPADFTQADVSAIQALSQGEATPEQQKRAFIWIMAQASGESYFIKGGADGERETNFGLGRAFVRQQILGLLKINLAALIET